MGHQEALESFAGEQRTSTEDEFQGSVDSGAGSVAVGKLVKRSMSLLLINNDDR